MTRLSPGGNRKKIETLETEYLWNMCQYAKCPYLQEDVMVKDHHKGKYDLKCSVIIFELTSGWAYVGLSKGRSVNDSKQTI